jgi:ATP-dependent helicase HrpB
VTAAALPIVSIRDAIVAALERGNRLVLTAPTGSGKTTQVPQFLAAMPAIPGQVVTLEPRRLAARMVARRVAQEMGSAPGGLVGWQTRFESAVSPGTRVRFVTEGVFLRQVQEDPELRGVGAVILDEFHERSLDGDLALGLVRRLQETSRPDLRLVVMSATLDAARVAGFLGCPALEASGRLFPVAIEQVGRAADRTAPEAAAEATVRLLGELPEGDVLVFMPGRLEIERTVGELARRVGPSTVVVPLHGSLPPAEQDRAVEPAPRGKRKVIVATNVAETSITIEGVRAVVDAGTARVHRHDPKRGLNTLRLEPIAKATAEQRAGRAGRLGPGRCLRLWSAAEHARRPAFADPEIARVDLADALLRLKSLGVADALAFPWFEPPPAELVAKAEAALRGLGAADEAGRITATGRAMAEMPCEPRTARLVVEGVRLGIARDAAFLAAAVGERDFVTAAPAAALREACADGDPVSDTLARLRILEAVDAGRRPPPRVALHPLGAREAAQAAAQYLRAASRLARRERIAERPGPAGPSLLRCLAVAFPDSIAFRPNAHKPFCHLAGRRKVVLDADSVVTSAGFLLALEVRESGSGDATLATLSMVTPLPRELLEELFPGRFSRRVEVGWNDATQAIEEVDAEFFDAIEIARTLRPARPDAATAVALAGKIEDGTIRLERWDDAVEQWIERVRCVAAWFPERRLITYDADELRLIRAEIATGAVRAAEIRDRPCLEKVKDALSWDEQEFVRKMAPETIPLRRGFRMKVEYRVGASPRGRAKIQDLYDEPATPAVAAGRVPVTLEILGPNHRPLQVTQDLANFWKAHYPEMRNQLARRYPRHEWR